MPAGPVPDPARLRATPIDVALQQTERWLVQHGLPYFVPSQRRAAREALDWRRTLPLLVLTVTAAVGVASLLVWWSGSVSAGPATFLTIGVLVAAAYAVTALRARPILAWAARRTANSLRSVLPMATRALPLLLVFVTFLFINGEAWQFAANMDGGVLWLVVALFVAFAIAFFLVRLPDELDRVGTTLDEAQIVRATQGTPIAQEAARLAPAPGVDLREGTRLERYERANLTLALVITQAVQIFVLALSVFAFFMLFGAVSMPEHVVEAWLGESPHTLKGLTNLSVELVQVSVFLAAFSGFYLTVYALTDDTYREQFLTPVIADLERAVAVRAAYHAALRATGAHDRTVPLEPVSPPSPSPGPR